MKFLKYHYDISNLLMELKFSFKMIKTEILSGKEQLS